MTISVKKKIRILFAVDRGAFPYHVGGDGTVAHTLLGELSKRGIDCEFFGSRRKSEKLDESKLDVSVEYTKDSIKYNLGYTATMAKGEFLEAYREKLQSFSPDFVFSQLDKSKEILEIAHDHGARKILYIHDAFYPENFRALDGPIDIILSSSNFIRDLVRKKYKKSSVTFYPPFISDQFKTETTKEYVTFINPHEMKGFNTALRLAYACPDRRFLFVEGWGVAPGSKEAIEKALPNAMFMYRQTDMKNVYGKTRVLIVPSRCEEAFGRVVVEAQVSGIPVVASNRGGLPESVGSGGLLIDDYTNVDDWINALEKLDDDQVYESFSNEARANTERFDLSAQIDEFLNVLDSALESN